MSNDRREFESIYDSENRQGEINKYVKNMNMGEN